MESGPDGIPKINMYPQETVSSGNSGTIDTEPANYSTNDLKRQIESGITQADLNHIGGALMLNNNGILELNCDTGVKAEIISSLQQIIGKPNILSVYSNVTGSGNNATYTFIRFVGVRIMEIELTGSKKKKKPDHDSTRSEHDHISKSFVDRRNQRLYLLKCFSNEVGRDAFLLPVPLFRNCHDWLSMNPQIISTRRMVGTGRRRQRRLGSAVVEFALVAPILILFVFGIIEFGRVMQVKNVITNASREAARAAVFELAIAEEVEQIAKDDYTRHWPGSRRRNYTIEFRYYNARHANELDCQHLL